jgi:hypothetical protein
MPEQKYERLELPHGLRGEVTVLQPVAVIQVSKGGIRVETSFPLHLDSLHDFRLTLGDVSVVVKGRIVHCRITDVEQEGVRYRAGVEFIEPSEHARHAIDRFVDDLRQLRQMERVRLDGPER